MQKARHRQTLSGQLVATISQRIADGTYAVGARLPSEQEMIEEFGVSRTVVREAIANLRATGTITTMHGVGAFVIHQEKPEGFEIEAASLSQVQEIIAVLELRIALESEAAVLAAQRRTDAHLAAMHEALEQMRIAIDKGEDAVQADMAFHRTIADAACNPHFLKLYNYVGELLIPRSRLRSNRIGGAPMADYLKRIHREHEQICYAIERQDPDAARAALRLHLMGSRDRLQNSIKKLPVG